MDLRKVVPVLVVVGLALGVAVLALTLRDDGGSDKKSSSSASSTSTSTTAATTTTTTTTQPPVTTPAVTPPGQAPATALPPGTVVEAPTQPPASSTPPPTDSSAEDPDETTAPTITTPDTDDDRDTVVYSPPDAPKRRGDLLVPAEHNSSAILLIHGGQGTKGSRKNVRPWADAYADAGYVTFSIDYFLFKDSTPPPVFPDPERDVKAAVQYLRDHADELGIDPDRIVVQGFSAGARLGAEAYTSGGDPYFAGEGLYGDISDVVNGFIGFYGPYNGNQSASEQYYGGPRDSDDPDVQARYARADSIAHAADAGGPALLFQGDADQLVPVTQASEFADALNAAGKDATLVVLPGADHGFDRAGRQLTPEGEAALADALEWLAQRFPET